MKTLSQWSREKDAVGVGAKTISRKLVKENQKREDRERLRSSQGKSGEGVLFEHKRKKKKK